MDNVKELKRMAVNAMTGHLTIADPVYELGKALESACEEVERLDGLEAKANDQDETIQEQADIISDMKRKAKEFATEMESA